MKKQHPLTIVIAGPAQSFVSSEEYNEKLRIAASHSMALAICFSTLHYLVQGDTFKDIHKITEKYYEHFYELYDYYNERLVQRGGKPVCCLDEIQQYCQMMAPPKNLKSAMEAKNEYSVEEACLKIMKKLSKAYAYTKRLKKLSADVEDFNVEDKMIEEIKWLEKEIWMVKSRIGLNVVN